MRTTNVHTWKVTSGLIVLLFIAVVLLILLPFVVHVYEKQKALSYQNEQIEFMGNWKEQLTELGRKQELLDERLRQMVVELAEEGEFSTIVEQLFLEARSAVLSIKKIQPIAEKESGEYTSKIVSLEVEGSYHSIARFINRVEQSGLMIEVHHFDIEQSDANTLNGSITLEITMVRSS
jgi:Tfp pilus assembly protein PilO